MGEDDLSGMRVLIVEDNYPVARSLRWLLSAYGAEVTAMVATVSSALRSIARDPPEVALLDVNLRGEDVFPVAIQLQGTTVPFAFLTGYGEQEIPVALRQHPRLSKPVGEAELISTLRSLVASKSG